jgi:predicted acylesterase/phospholipase RssA
MQTPIFRCIHRLAGPAAAAALALAAAGCALTPGAASTNRWIEVAKPAAPPVRASLAVDGRRGNPRVLMLLAVSGGGSRSAFFASEVMMRLQNERPETDLLAEVDAISAVSGGALPAAYYALSRDEFLRRPALARRLAPMLAGQSDLAMLSTDAAAGTLKCSAALTDAARLQLDAWLADDRPGYTALDTLCQQAGRGDRRVWSQKAVEDQMSKNYVRRLLLNMLWPANFLPYWFSAFDRADIMAQTFADNLLDPPDIRSGARFANNDFTFADIDESRPYLILNATNATEQNLGPASPAGEMPFGSVFSFTQEDFVSQLASDIGAYSVARAVMASSAFPVVFPAMSLCDFRGHDPVDKFNQTACPTHRYMHVFDGGNSDNLGLKSIKRILLQKAVDGELARDYDAVVVVLIDAFATPLGISRGKYDPRVGLDFLIDSNVTDAVDSLLRTNRQNQIREFRDGTLRWSRQDCEAKSRELPPALCAQLDRADPKLGALLSDRLVFLHIGFDDVKGQPDWQRQLNAIPTSFSISDDHALLLRATAEEVFKQTAGCLAAIEAIVLAAAPDAALGGRAHATCQQEEHEPAASGPASASLGGPLSGAPRPDRGAAPPVHSARSENTAP